MRQRLHDCEDGDPNVHVDKPRQHRASSCEDGSVNGNMQQAPHAIAPVESVVAVTPAAFEPGGSAGALFTAGDVLVHAQVDAVGAFATN